MHTDITQNLIGVDKYRYDESWELSEFLVAKKLYGSTIGLLGSLLSKIPTEKLNGCHPNGIEKPTCSAKYVTPESSPELDDPPSAGKTCTLQKGTTLLDLRTATSYATDHLPGATNLPLSSLLETSPSPFSDSNTLELQWCELEGLCTHETSQLLEGKTVVFIDYGGDTARVATSVFRARGVEAWSLKNGIKGLAKETDTEPQMEIEIEMETEPALVEGMNAKGPPASLGLGIGNVGSNFLSLQ